ncbi:unknown [Firmicutes bacterium CAG:882]|jgi:hypothetical protein|nr:unknown [Firmicutes bacterium CAG:882]
MFLEACNTLKPFPTWMSEKMQWSHDGDFASVADDEMACTGFLEHLSFVQRSFMYKYNTHAFIY